MEEVEKMEEVEGELKTMAKERAVLLKNLE